MNERHLKKVNAEINTISPSFCIAKWKQVTLHLQNGHTHSCHHPDTHLIPLEELKTNKSALHNTNFKKSQRDLMLNGVRPKECDYCWKVEDSGDQYSDRTYKSAEAWAYPSLVPIATSHWSDNVDPSYVEVSFSNVCNFKCSYCSPNISSKWMEEIEQHGSYPTSNKFNNIEWFKQTNKMPIPNNQDNPYVDAFWEWWPSMYLSLQHFRITGGEPLLNKNTFRILDYIIENPNPNLVLSINSNLNPPKDLLDKFIEKIRIIEDRKLVKEVQLFTSAEAQGAQAEYIRFGLNYNEWMVNLERMLVEAPATKIFIMATYNLLSIPTFKGFLEDMIGLRRKYHANSAIINHSPVTVDIPYLRYPRFLSALIAPAELLHYVQDQIKFMEAHAEPTSGSFVPYMGFHTHEIDKLRRIYDIMKTELAKPDAELTMLRKDFVAFVNEHDARRGTNFLETYPELEQVYTEWSYL